VVALDAGDLGRALRQACGGSVDLTIDTLWGEPAEAAIGVAARHARHVQIGQLAATTIELSAPAIRSVSLDVRGFSIAHPPRRLLREAYRELATHVARGDVVVDLERVPLADVAQAWRRQGAAGGGPKLVIVP
jgi:NADPH2:quinone reductase